MKNSEKTDTDFKVKGDNMVWFGWLYMLWYAAVLVMGFIGYFTAALQTVKTILGVILFFMSASVLLIRK